LKQHVSRLKKTDCFNALPKPAKIVFQQRLALLFLAGNAAPLQQFQARTQPGDENWSLDDDALINHAGNSRQPLCLDANEKKLA